MLAQFNSATHKEICRKESPRRNTHADTEQPTVKVLNRFRLSSTEISLTVGEAGMTLASAWFLLTENCLQISS